MSFKPVYLAIISIERSSSTSSASSDWQDLEPYHKQRDADGERDGVFHLLCLEKTFNFDFNSSIKHANSVLLTYIAYEYRIRTSIILFL